MSTSATVWQNYEIDPRDLIGKTVTVLVVTNEGSTGKGRWGTGHLHFGVIESVHENRGRVYLDEPGDNWAAEALDVSFMETYPSVSIRLRGGEVIRFDPERDAVSIQWEEQGAF